MKASDHENMGRHYITLRKQYDQEIQKQKGSAKKITTSRRWLRDAKQGKLSDVPSAMKGLERIVPRGYNYYTNPSEVCAQDTVLIDYIQADLEYLESLEEGKQELSVIKPYGLKHDGKKEQTQSYCDHIIDKKKPMWQIPKEKASKLVKELGIFEGDVDDILDKCFSFKDKPETYGVIETAPKIINGRPSPIGFLPEVFHQLYCNRLITIGEYIERKYAFIKDFFIYPGHSYSSKELYKSCIDKLGSKQKEEIEKIITPYSLKKQKPKLG